MADAQSQSAWIRVFDDKHRRHYFFNTETGESRWTMPPGVDISEASRDVQEAASKARRESMRRESIGRAAAGESPERPTPAQEPSAANQTMGVGMDGAGAGAASPAAAGAGGAADAGADAATRDDPAGTRKKIKLRSIAKGVANVLGLRKKHGGKLKAAEAAAAGSQPVAAAAGGAAAGASSPAGDGPRTPPSGAAAGGGGAGDDFGELRFVRADDNIDDDDDEDTPRESRLTRTMSDVAVHKRLERRPSILKRPESMRVKPSRRISFADQSPGGDGKLTHVRYVQDLHYSPGAAHQAGGEDEKCSLM